MSNEMAEITTAPRSAPKLIGGNSIDLYKAQSLSKVRKISKAINSESLDVQLGIQGGEDSEINITWFPKPVDDEAIRSLKDDNSHHANCLMAKVNATVSLGFIDDDEEEKEDKMKKRKADRGKRADIDTNTVKEELKNVVKAETAVATATTAPTTKEPATSEPNIANDIIADESPDRAISALLGARYTRTEVDERLDPLTIDTFRAELHRATQDYYDLGRGFLKVSRKSSDDTIFSVAYIEAPCVEVGALRKTNKDLSAFATYRVFGLNDHDILNWVDISNNNRSSTLVRSYVFAFNETPNEFKIDTINGMNYYEEIIPFIQPSSRFPYTSYPSWLSAVPSIDLTRSNKQFKSDFYTNRGVLDSLIVLKSDMGEEKYNSFVSQLEGNIVTGSKFKTVIVQLESDKADVVESIEVIPLAKNTTATDQFPKDQDNLNSDIVTSHGVPPVLGNILIQGKMGATNEVINALVTFQLITININQDLISSVLASTLGSKEAKLGLHEDDFILRTVLGEMDMPAMDTVSRMRTEASSTTRDVSEGLVE